MVVSLPLFGELLTGEKEAIERLGSHLLIRDHNGAIQEGELALQLYPNDPMLLKIVVQTFAESGEVRKALELYEKRCEMQPLDLREDFSMIESLAWGMIQNHATGSDYAQTLCLIGSYFTHDSRATDAILRGMQSRNAQIRAISVKMSVQYRDQKLQDQLCEMLKNQSNYFVRLELIRAVGELRIAECRKELERIVSDFRSTHEEKGSAIHSLAMIYDEIDEHKLDLLLKSKKAGLRQLGVNLIGHFDMTDQVADLTKMLDDPSLDVRLQALCSLTTLDLKSQDLEQFKGKVISLARDDHPYLALTAAALASRFDQGVCQETFSRWMTSHQPRVRRYAAACLGMCGEGTIKKGIEFFYEASDLYVKANLAMGLLKQRAFVGPASEFLHEFLTRERGRVMIEPGVHPMVGVILPSEVSHLSGMPHYVEMVDQLARLQILNLLAVLEYPKAKEIIKEFLAHRIFGVGATANMMLLEEGDLEAMDLVKECLDDPDENISMQAAFALAMFAKDQDVAIFLIKHYEKVDWEKKIQIIEALGRIGNRDSIPFLIERLKDPFQMVQIASASSIIQCLYH